MTLRGASSHGPIGGGGITMAWKVYRPGEGRLGRLGALAVIIMFGAFASYRWHLQASAWTRWLPLIGQYQVNWGELGAGILLVGVTLLGYRLCFVRPKSSDFLIETEIELRKVRWPAWKPLFKASTELWGSAYVVIIVVAALATFVGVVDLLLHLGANRIFFR